MNHIHDYCILCLINIVVYMCVYYACTFPSSHVFVLIDLCFECFYASHFMFWNNYILLLFRSYETTLRRCSNAFAAPEDVRQIRRGAVLTVSVNDMF